MRFQFKEEFLVKIDFIKEIKTLNKKIIKKVFSNIRVPNKKVF